MKKIKLILALAGATLLSANALAVDNNPPMVNGIPGESIQEGGKFATINLDNYVSDDMDKPEQIKWSVSGNKNLKVSINDRVATIETPHPYWNGEENITFAATDSKGAIGSETVTFTVKHVFDENGFCRCDDYQPAEKNDDGYYKIANAGNLCWFANFVNQGNFTANAVLTNNIVVNTLEFADGEIVTSGWVYRVWSPIGPDYIYPYQGTFDGNGHTISGLYFNDPDQDFVGLFGCNNGTIQNAGVVDSYFYGKDHVGGVCGGNAEGKIENCYNAGNVNGSRIEVGGVCGYNAGGTITNCHNTGEVNGESSVGGVCGYNFEGKIENCYNTGNVNGSCNEVGGVCGYNAGGTITNCHNTGNVNGSSNYVGGVCGYNRESTITNCYNTGEVNGDSYVGGVLGNLGQYCNIENCYNTGVVSGNGDYVGGVCGYNRESTITNCYYLNSSASEGLGDGAGEATAQTAEEFADGTVTSLLNANGNNAWKQGLNYPMLISNHIHEYANGLCVICNEYQQPTKDGNGVYQIANAGNLYWFADFVNKGGDNANANAVLTANITVNENLLESLAFDEEGNVTNGETFEAWLPIGNASIDFYGTFDGNGNTISGLYFNKSNQYNVGLFGQITGNAVIKNVGVIDSYFKGDVGVGGVCGDNDSSKGLIENCYNASIVIGNGYVGGVCGENSGTITNCYNAGGIKGHYSYSYTGGVCGFSEKTIINCYNIGDIEGYYDTGGVCGSNESLIKNCYNTGEVNGDEKTGGVCGYNYYGTIQYCHNVGMVNSEHYYIGGVCGYNSYGTIQHCYFNSDIYQGDASYGDETDETVAGKSSADFKNLVIGLLNVNGNNVWGQGLSYPMLISNHIHEYANGLCVICNEYQQPTKDGNGVCQIANAGNLYWFADFVNQGGDNANANAVLTANITINNDLFSKLNEDGTVKSGEEVKEWFPIGYYIETPYTDIFFGGTFDGNGHTISGLYFNNENQVRVGLFGQITESATIKNVGVIDSYFSGNYNVGGVCGYNTAGTITNCYNTGEVNGEANIGGVCGYNTAGTITNCYNTGEVNGESSVGGVCGYIILGTITNCYNTSLASGSSNIGGVCGSVGNYCAITNCYNTGEVNGDSYVGGVLGDLGQYCNIENCYNTGVVSGNGDYVGGVCGYNKESTITNCYYLNSSASEGLGDGAGEAIAQTAEQFASGEVAYKLGGAFFQTIGEDALPVLDNTHGKVYQTSPCIAYSNTENAVLEHNFDENGFCTACGAYEPATDSDADGYYEIANAGNLYWFAEYVNQGDDNAKANAVLTADIVVNKDVLDNDGNLNAGKFNGWSPIGYWKSDNEDIQYAGTFDGGGHTISGLYFNNPNVDCVGLFGQISRGATIKNVGVIDSYFEGSFFVGGVCGWNEGTIANCYSASDANGSNIYVGGVCGSNYNGTITNCYNTGDVNGNECVGGVCGANYDTIENCYSTGAVKGSSDYVGGVCGFLGDNCTIINCYFLSGTDAKATQATAEQFANGTVAKALRNYDNGKEDAEKIGSDVWGQNTSTDTVPNLSGKIIFKVTLTAENGIAENGLGEYNKKYEIKATPNAGYHFVEWSNGSTEIKDSILVECDTALVATFEAHSFGNWDTTLVATCAVAGLRTHACACGEVETDTIAKLAHTVVVDSAKTATCTATGLTAGLHCSVCDSVFLAQQTVAKLAHTIVIDSAKTATCTIAGLTEGKHCSVCDSILVKQNTIPAGHKIVIDSAKTATCTATGLTEGKHCSVCDSIFVAQQTIAKLAHTVVVDSAKNATCTATGLTEGKHCSVCDSILVAQQTIAKLAHTVVVDSAKTATCTAEGLTEGKHCSVCNEVIKAQDTIPALGHSFTNYIYNNDATTEADGTEKAECDREGCNAIDVRTAEGTKLQTSVGTELAEGVVIYAHHSTIVVENATEDIFIYNADGRMIARETVTANRMEMPMTEQGVYIVRTGDTTQRVFVK